MRWTPIGKPAVSDNQMDPIDWSVFDNVRCVFWMCSDHEMESVTWTKTEGKMTPKCNYCGKMGTPQ